jgi:AraC-like DNA-binding protein
MAEILVSSVGQPTSTVFTWDHRASLESLLVTQTEAVRSGEWGTVWSRSALVYQFLTQLRDQGRPLGQAVGTIADLDERMGPLFEYVEEHLADPDLGVDSMAGFLGVSPRQLTDLFGKVGPLSPYQYLKDRRMNRARQLLLGSRELGVKEISFRVGFRDPSHFIQTFRHTVGKSPDQFRRALVPTG